MNTHKWMRHKSGVMMLLSPMTAAYPWREQRCGITPVANGWQAFDYVTRARVGPYRRRCDAKRAAEVLALLPRGADPRGGSINVCEERDKAERAFRASARDPWSCHPKAVVTRDEYSDARSVTASYPNEWHDRLRVKVRRARHRGGHAAVRAVYRAAFARYSRPEPRMHHRNAERAAILAGDIPW